MSLSKSFETDSMLRFEWEINANLLRDFYWKHYTKSMTDHCVSNVITHSKTNTKWVLVWWPYGHPNITKYDCVICLMLVNKPDFMKSITIDKTLFCKQINLNMCLKNDTYNRCNQFRDWGSQQKYKINEWKQCENLTFGCEIKIIKLEKNNDIQTDIKQG